MTCWGLLRASASRPLLPQLPGCLHSSPGFLQVYGFSLPGASVVLCTTCGILSSITNLTKVENGKQAYWHDVLWFYFHNDGQFETFSEFRKTLSTKKGYRVDHMGGLPNETNVLFLQLQTAGESVKQGGQRRRALKLTGEGALLQRRLLKQYAHRRLLKRPVQNMSGFAYSRQPPKVSTAYVFKTDGAAIF